MKFEQFVESIKETKFIGHVSCLGEDELKSNKEKHKKVGKS